MNKLLTTLMVAALSLNAYSTLAADQTKTNTEDAQEGLVQDDALNNSSGASSSSTGSSTSGKKHSGSMKHKSGKSAHNMDYKMMDTNGDGMISKEEYMSHHEMAYGKMKQTNGGVSMKDMNAQMNLGTTKGNKIQPSNTKDVAPEPRS